MTEPVHALTLVGNIDWSRDKNKDRFHVADAGVLWFHQVWLASAVQAVKVSPLIEKVSDHKDFKKLLRTRTNVLVLYTKTGETFLHRDIGWGFCKCGC